MFTLDGRMKFQLALTPQQEAAFHTHRLQEIVLRRVGTQFELGFQFGPPTAAAAVPPLLQAPELALALQDAAPQDAELDDEALAAGWPPGSAAGRGPSLVFPEYLKVEDHA
jgi:hypothetical protein